MDAFSPKNCPYRGNFDGETVGDTDILKCYPCSFDGDDFEGCQFYTSLQTLETLTRRHGAECLRVTMAAIKVE